MSKYRRKKRELYISDDRKLQVCLEVLRITDNNFACKIKYLQGIK